MNREINKNFIGVIVLGIILTFIPLSLIYYEDDVLRDFVLVNFNDPAGEQLEGTYYPGSRDAGIILLHGYAGDQMTMKGIATEFARLGFHVFSFDFSGHGRSSGAMEFAYTRSDRLAKQVIAGKEKFKELSGLDDSKIILFGHSMGARVALQSSTFDGSRVKMLILFGCYVNLEPSARSSTYRMPSDFELEWIKSLSKNNPPVDILLLTGELDDTSTPYRNYLLYQKLGGSSSNYIRELVIIDDLIHGYETYSPEAITHALHWVMINLGSETITSYSATTMVMRKILWTISVIGIFMLTIGGSIFHKNLKSQYETQSSNLDNNQEFFPGIRIVSMKKFLTRKILFWLAAIPVIIGILILFLTFPLDIPFISLISVSSIGGHGILMILIYSQGKMPGTRGFLNFKLKIENNKQKCDILKGLALAISLIFTSTIFACSGIFYVYPINDRLIWLIVLTVFSIPGFFVMQLEFNSFFNSNLARNKRRNGVILTIFVLYPFFSYAAMLGSLHGIIILIFVLSGGVLVQKIGKNSTLTVVIQAFLMNYLLLSQGVLYPGFF